MNSHLCFVLKKKKKNNIWEAEVGESLTKPILVYKATSRTARATQVNPVLNSPSFKGVNNKNPEV